MSDHLVVSPPPESVKAELERVLASEAFANAGRVSRLLRYIVERTLAGEGGQLKEYVLGVDVFDRGDQFDPRLDSIVRVEARRLRSKLDEYYAAAGAPGDVRIVVPRGSYVPIFEKVSGVQGSRVPGFQGSTVPGFQGSTVPGFQGSEVPGFQGSEVPGFQGSKVPEFQGAEVPRVRRSWISGVSVLALLGVTVGLLIASVAWRPGASAALKPSVAVLPFEEYSGTPEGGRLAARLTDAVTSELARLGSVSVVSRTSARQFEGTRKPIREIAAALDADIVMEATVEVGDQRVKVMARLVDAARDRKMWVEAFEAPQDEVGALPHRIAVSSAEAVARRR